MSKGISLRLPVRPARFLKTQHVVAALVAAILGLASITGFVWASKSVTLVVDGRSTSMTTESETVASLLDEAGVRIGKGDLVSPSASRSLDDGDVVVVRHAVPVTLEISGGSIDVDVLGRTVADALVTLGLDPTGGLKVHPSVDTKLSPGMTITAIDVFFRVQEEEVVIPFDTVVEGDSSLPAGKRITVTKGVEGSGVRVWQVLVTGGVEGPRTLKMETVLTPPVDKVVRVGTRRPFRQVLAARSGDAGVTRDDKPSITPPVVGRTIRVESTAYTPYECGKDATWVASRVRRYDIPEGWGLVAVDPRVIPLGSRLFVEGYGYAVAADTGGAIKGRMIDVCYWGSSLRSPMGHASAAQRRIAIAACTRWGRRYGVRVTILGS